MSASTIRTSAVINVDLYTVFPHHVNDIDITKVATATTAATVISGQKGSGSSFGVSRIDITFPIQVPPRAKDHPQSHQAYSNNPLIGQRSSYSIQLSFSPLVVHVVTSVIFF